MNERLIFVRNQGLFNLKAETTDTVYQRGQKVKVTVKATDKNDRPLVTYLSAAVTDETRLPEEPNNESTIFSHLLLTSELKGYVDKPGYYFNSKNDKAGADLDILMLTQGYRRFEWKRVLNDSLAQRTFQPEKIARVSGKIKNMEGKPVPFGSISLLSAGKTFFFLDTVADKDGNFVFEHFPVSDSARYIIQATDKRLRQKTLIQLDRTIPPEITTNRYVPDESVNESNNLSAYFNFNKKFHQQQINRGIGKQSILLKEITVRETKIKMAVKHSANLNGPGTANDVITAEQLPKGCLVFADCIAGHLHGIKYGGQNFYYGFFPTLVLIDGVEVPGNLVFKNFKMTNSTGPSQAEVLDGLNMNDVASIEIIRDASLAAVYGTKGAGGVIIITMKTFEDMMPEASSIKTHFVYYSPVTYSKARQFYSPLYDKLKLNPALNDLRTTIYWNPDIITDENGSSVLQFYNAGTKGRYRIKIEGVDDKGNLGSVMSYFQVE